MMNIGRMINDYGKAYTPYMGNLVNHLPMGQLALFQLTGDLEKVKDYSEFFTRQFRINEAEGNAARAESFKACVGKRDQYESCLILVQDRISSEGMVTVIREVLNTYPLGMSSGLFHVLIRLAYAVEGANIDKQLEEEVARALAYYVTACREAGLLERTVKGDQLHVEMNRLADHKHIRSVLDARPSMGQQMKALYEDEVFLSHGFVVEGTEEEKITGLISLILPVFDQSLSIVVLHCLTGLHALINLKPYFEDFLQAIDIYTTCCITHLLTVEGLDYQKLDHQSSGLIWEKIKQQGAASRDVHTIKFTYTCHELDRRYAIEGLMNSALNKIGGK
jgi:hypothetical protein